MAELNFTSDILKFADYIPQMLLLWDGETTRPNKSWDPLPQVHGNRSRWPFAIHPEDRDAVLEVLHGSPSSGPTEVRIETAPGKYEMFRMHFSPTSAPGGLLIFTPTRKMETAPTDRCRDYFLANISHEIRTPVGAMIGFAELIQSAAQVTSESRLYAEKIKTNGKHLENIINEILDFSKMEAGHIDIEMDLLNLRDFFKELEEACRSKNRVKNLNLKFELDPRVPAWAKFDPKRLRQIFLNLVGNALKFTDRGEVAVVIGCETADNPYEFELVASVTDTGVGVRSEDRGALFKPFFQTDLSLSRKYSGTGLGLTLTREIARKMGGDVRLLQSDVGEGSVFQVHVKLGKAEGVPPKGPNSENQTGAGRFRDLKILVVDDSNDNQVILKHMLKKTGAHVSLAGNGPDGIRKARADHYDIILMDVQMPEMSGHEATRQLRAGGYEKPIVAITAHAMEMDRELSFRSGCDDHLTKPINIKALFDTVAHLSRSAVPAENQTLQ